MAPGTVYFRSGLVGGYGLCGRRQEHCGEDIWRVLELRWDRSRPAY